MKYQWDIHWKAVICRLKVMREIWVEGEGIRDGNVPSGVGNRTWWGHQNSGKTEEEKMNKGGWAGVARRRENDLKSVVLWKLKEYRF